MKIAITGGAGFVGRNIASLLVARGHEVVLVSRRPRKGDSAVRFVSSGLDDVETLVRAFSGCDAVAHCAGINREIGTQTYQAVHVEGTRNVVEAARRGGARKIIVISFLRARPDCGSGYHESKWKAEEIVRQSGLNYTVFKCGVIYGRGDHMLDHLSHAFHTFPVFALVGMRDKPIRPNAVEDVARLVVASLVDNALPNQTVAVVGPEEMTLGEAVRRVAGVVGRTPLMFRMPVWFHYALGWVAERIMVVPLVSLAQVRILSEGLVEPVPRCAMPPGELAPRIRFSDEQIRRGLPQPGPFGWRDIRCLHRKCRPMRRIRRVFMECP